MEFKPTWFLTLLGGFKAQYIAGYDYKETLDEPLYNSNWVSPSYTDLSLGIDWKPNEIFLSKSLSDSRSSYYGNDSLLRKKYGVPIDKTLRHKSK
jgi:hypothetical protein